MITKAPVLKVLGLIFLSCFISCASGKDAYREIDAGVNAASYEHALEAIEKPSTQKTVYPPRNEILFFLDRGMIRHYAGLWHESTSDLQEAERLIEAAFTKSITQEIGTFIVNDNVRDYPGEDYEDIYINVFNALNYYHRGNIESALVEIRRVNEKLRYLSGKYERAADKVISSNTDLNDPQYDIEAISFSNSALARYLSMLFFRSYGNADNARIDLEELYRAYELAPNVYNHSPPSGLEDELQIPQGQARLNAIAFAGLSPVKEEINLPIPLPLPFPNNWTRLALPQMVDRPSVINSIEIVIDGGGLFRLELIEDMNRVARETFKGRFGLTVLKSTARTITKSAVNAGVSKAVNNQSEGLGALVSIFGRIATNLSENADLRAGRYFPGRVFVGGITLEPGVYSITINYYGSGRLVASETRNNVEIGRNKLNLLEFICLK